MSTYRPAVMTRFGGKPYWTGEDWRCVECNGLFADGRCQTCGAVPTSGSGRPRHDVVGHYQSWLRKKRNRRRAA